jgi:hypothetical protein
MTAHLPSPRTYSARPGAIDARYRRAKSRRDQRAALASTAARIKWRDGRGTTVRSGQVRGGFRRGARMTTTSDRWRPISSRVVRIGRHQPRLRPGPTTRPPPPWRNLRSRARRVDRAAEERRPFRERSFTSVDSTGTLERREQALALRGGLPFLLVQVYQLDGHKRVHVDALSTCVDPGR